MEPVDIVISGIGGRFPRSNNWPEFSEHLKAGQTLLQPTTRWTPGWLGSPKTTGEILDYDKFDNAFFGIHSRIAGQSDIAARIILEVVFEAVADAGLSLQSISGTNAQVYGGASSFETDVILFNLKKADGYSIMGRNRSMMANRVSYFLNVSGRSTTYDANNGWVGIGLDLARKAVQAGECDTAFVVASSVLVVKEFSKQKQTMGLLTEDDSCNPFDFDVDGLVRGEGAVALVVQRADIAKRSYGSIIAAGGTSQGHLPDWLLSVNEDHLHNFVSTLYRTNGVDPNKIKLLEADGLCHKEMLASELNVLDQILNRGRPKEDPLLIGSVKSITGDAEGAGGHMSLTKLLHAMDTGIISPTTTCGKYNQNVPGLIEGRYKVIAEPTKWDVTDDTHVALSCVSVGGIVGHAVIKAHGKAKKTYVKSDYHLPYLILLSARNEDIAEKALKEVTSSPFDPEYLRLVQEFFVPKIDRYVIRGYGFHGEEKIVVQKESRRPVWFVYSGMGSQWVGMGKDLIGIPIAKETFERLHLCLKPKGIDLIHILTSSDETIFESILHSFVGITAIQIALTNLLDRLDIKPDGIIGHSVGELGCSYADGCLTEEQTILAAYARGVASLKADLEPGLMAAVGLGYKDAQQYLPPEVVVACRNSATSSTLSGPTKQMKETVKLFEDKKIFVKAVNVSNIAYHSPYIKPAAPYLFEFLSQVIPAPKLRSSKWICTSAPEEKWDSDEVRYCSAEYHTNNLLSSVYFEEGSAHVPKDALAIEIAPHGLLQAILKKSFGQSAVNVSLTKRGVVDQSKVLLETIGQLYLEGLSPKIWHLYPDVSFPVSRNTPSPSSLVGWDREHLPIPVILIDTCYSVTEELDYSSPSSEIYGERALLPAYALVSVWKIIAAATQEDANELPIVFDDVYFHSLINLKTSGTVGLQAAIMPGSGEFSIMVNDVIAITGRATILDLTLHKPANLTDEIGEVELCLSSEDVYAEMKSRCVTPRDSDKTIKNVEIHQKDWFADIEFDGDWSRLLNSLLTLCQLSNHDCDQSPSSVRHIQKLIIDPSSEKKDEKVRLRLPASTLVYRGVELYTVDFETIEKPPAKFEPLSFRFIPYGHINMQDDLEFLFHLVHLSLEKRLVPVTLFNIYDVDGEHSSLAQKLRHILTSKLSIECEIIHEPKGAALILCGATSIAAVAPIVASTNILLLTQCRRDQRKAFSETLSASGLEVIAESQEDERAASLVVVTNPLPSAHLSDCSIIKMDPDEMPYQTPESSGLVIMVWEEGCRKPIERIYQQLTTLHKAEKVRLVFLMSPDAPPFSLNLPLYANQICRNVPVNVYVDGKWGGYRLLPMPDISQSRPDICQELSRVAANQGSTSNGNGPVKLNYVGLSTERRPKKENISSELYNSILDYSGELENKVKVMGFAYYDVSSGLFKRDPQLIWKVPEGWSLAEAATVPCAYAMMYYAIFEVSVLKTIESLLITCPLTPAGQAALRIALNIDCDVFVVAASLQERDCLQRMFPKLSPSRILLSATDTFTCELMQKCPEGLRLIISDLTGARLRAATNCMRDWGRFVQIGADSMATCDYIGMFFFVKSGSVLGVTEQRLLNATVEMKNKVVAWVQKGLDENIVRPIEERTVYSGKQLSEALQAPQSGNTNKRIVCLQEETNDVKGRKMTVPLNEPDKCAVIIGGSKSQWMRVAYWLARKGSKHITLVTKKPSPNLVLHHGQVLRHNFRTKLKELNATKGADLVDQILQSGPIQTIIVFSPSKLVEDVVSHLGKKGLSNTRVISFSEHSSPFSLMCERWTQTGLTVRSALGVEDGYTDATGHLFDLLLSSAAPPVSVFNGPAFFFKKEKHSLDNSGMFPTSVDELRTLAAGLRKKNKPTFRELATICTSSRHNPEIQPLFFIKGVHATANVELETLASNLLCPMFDVTVPANCISLERTAEIIVEELQKVQRRGPYTLAGDPIRTPVIIRIAHILEERGHASVVFLMDEGITAVRKELKVLEEDNDVNVTLLKLTLFENLSPEDWNSVKWDTLSWKEQVSVVLSKIPSLDENQRQDVISALDHVKDSLNHIIQGHETIKLNHGIVHFFRKGEKYQEHDVGERITGHVIPSSKLKDKDIGDIIGGNAATPVLQLNFEKAKLGKKSTKEAANILNER